MRKLAVLLMALTVAACTPSKPPPPPPPPTPPPAAPVEKVVQVRPGVNVVLLDQGVGLVLPDRVGVTTMTDGLDPKRIFGKTEKPNLFFFATDRNLDDLPEADAAAGDAVTVHCVGGKGESRVLHGIVDPKRVSACKDCDQKAFFTIALADWTMGLPSPFGAPVLDKEGRIVGFVYSISMTHRTTPDPDRHNYATVIRLSYARDALGKLISANPGDP